VLQFVFRVISAYVTWLFIEHACLIFWYGRCDNLVVNGKCSNYSVQRACELVREKVELFFEDTFSDFTFMLPCVVIDFFVNKPDALIIPILFCYKPLHVSGIFSAHHQEVSAVHSALVSFMEITSAECTVENS